MDNEALVEANGASPGFGSTANSFLPLVNVEEGTPRMGSAGLHRASSAGAGASTAYHDRRSTAKREIQAGEELYVDYGGHWFRGRSFLGPIPLYDDLKKATRLYKKYKGIEQSVTVTHPNATTVMQQVWKTFVAHSEWTMSRVLGSFHHDKMEDEFEELDAAGGNVMELRRQQSARSLEWLRAHGTCGDHLEAAPSTVQEAGRGAVATRDLPEGTIVAQLPLIHITQRHRLDMYPLQETASGSWEPDKSSAPSTRQLLLNYCYGHGASTILLCPYGPMVNFVNHNRSLANVRLVWGDPVRGNHMPRLLEQPLEELDADATAKLAFEMIATRPIAKGDELFLDYGHAWEQAWQEHVRQWEPVPGAKDYLSATAYNRTQAILRTVFAQEEDPYPENMELLCVEQVFSKKAWDKAYKAGDLYDNLHLSEGYRHCDILRSEVSASGEILYTVADHDDDELHEGLPRLAFHFVDRPYTTDMFLDNAFRHDIRIPDEIFPQVWKNLEVAVEE
jgi:hypothetical protein